MGNNNIRILHVVGAMNRAGAESMLMELYRNLDRTHIQFDFLEFSEESSDYSEEIRSLGGRIHKCNWSLNPKKILSTYDSIRHIIESEGPYTAVHSHILFGSSIVVSAARAAGVDIRIAHSHSSADGHQGLISNIYRWIGRYFIWRNSTSLVACSREAAAFLFGSKSSEGDFTILPNAVDLAKFRPSSRRTQSNRPLSLVVVGRLEAVKNHQFIVELADGLRRRDLEFVIRIIGAGSLQHELQAAVKDRDLDRNIKFLGLQNNVDEYLRESDALLMPSLWEGLPVALVEAQATAVPCLVSDTISQEADLGLGLVTYLPINNVKIWVDRLIRGFDSGPSQEEINASFHQKSYTLEKSMEILMSIYQKLD